jgi:hypothetical protein
VAAISVDAVMAELQDRITAKARADMLRHGASPALSDPAVFAEVSTLLADALERSDVKALLLPELLGEPRQWKLETAIAYRSHRGGVAAAAILFLKRRVLMPVHRWLFEYSRDNFERQQRVNEVLFACVQELAVETARLRQELQRRPQ